MSINKNNYEAFFLDYHEGNLSPQQVADLLLFVEQHPELKEEFESFENVTLDDFSSISFEDKSSLKKEITLDNKEEYFIRAVENTLTPAEKNLLESFVKQHPQFLPELELFKKTIVTADAAIIFEGKESLKRIAVTTDDLLIASVEGLLSKQETTLLNQQIAVDAQLQHNYGLYKQTKLVADTSIVYENKEELKRDLTPALSKGAGEYESDDKERKIIPFFYYVAAAASVALLLFFFYNNGKTKVENFANNNHQVKTIPNGNNANTEIKNNEAVNPNVIVPVQTASIVKHRNKHTNSVIGVSKDSAINTPIIVNESPIITIAENKNENKHENTPQVLPIIKNEQPIAMLENNQPAINNKQPSEFLSLRELASQKIKEKTLDKETVAIQEKNGRSKRFTGWDLAQIVTRGISKVTGRNVEVKPTYNDEGDVTAYALGGGVQISRGK